MKPTCFVIQGYGKKTDYTNGRVLDLDKSYNIIKMGIENAGLESIRADEIIHSGVIDVPMYKWLLEADVVIADLSTYNVNAAYELGIRHALKPNTTIVLAEDQLKYPFDLNHIVVRNYRHMGDDIGFSEANRLMNEIKKAIQAILDSPAIDSPVYTYLPALKPPFIPTNTILSGTINAEITRLTTAPSPLPSNTPAEVANITGDDNPSAKAMLDTALQKINTSDFLTARILLSEVDKLRPTDCFVIQQLALATYKSKQPTVIESLEAAKNILKKLTPETTNNPETLGLWGAIHKRLWEKTTDIKSLDESITAYERGFYLKQDHYNGINLAYLLDVRALEFLKAGKREEAIADHVVAQRVRQSIIRYVEPTLQNIEDVTSRYWVVATLYEAAIGLEDSQAISQWENQANTMNVADWMQETRKTQAEKLQKLLADYQDQLKTM